MAPSSSGCLNVLKSQSKLLSLVPDDKLVSGLDLRGSLDLEDHGLALGMGFECSCQIIKTGNWCLTDGFQNIVKLQVVSERAFAIHLQNEQSAGNSWIPQLFGEIPIERMDDARIVLAKRQTIDAVCVVEG